MSGRTGCTLLLLLLCGFDLPAHAQDDSATTDQPSQLKIVVAAPNMSSDDVIAIPPDTSWTGTFARDPKRPVVTQDSSNLAAWIQKESALNGLQSVDLRPWHIVIEYDQFDEDGDNVHSGVLEEVWVGPKAYRRSYKSDNLNQTDYATEQGLFRLGDQRWPNRAELQVRSEIIDPFSYAATLQGFTTRNVERTFGTHSLDCVLLERTDSGTMSGPTHTASNTPVQLFDTHADGAGFKQRITTCSRFRVVAWPAKRTLQMEASLISNCA